MKCGRFWANNCENSGPGWPSLVPAGASWLGCWAGVMRPRPGAYGWRSPSGITDTAGPSPTYTKVLPRWQHRPCAKGAGQTNIVEAINCSLRKHCGALVRKSCSFNKSLAIPTARIKIIIHNYNQNVILD